MSAGVFCYMNVASVSASVMEDDVSNGEVVVFA